MLSTKKLLYKVLELLENRKSIYTTRSTTCSGTVGANTNARITGTLPTVAGYVPVAIMYIRTDAGANATITEFGINYQNDSHNVSSVVRNVGNSSITVTHTYGVLYMKLNVA